MSFRKLFCIFKEPELRVEVVMMGVSSISLLWSVTGDTAVDSEVLWRGLSDSGSNGSSGSLSSYTIPDLRPLSVYSITVNVSTLSSGSRSESIVSFKVFIEY